MSTIGDLGASPRQALKPRLAQAPLQRAPLRPRRVLEASHSRICDCKRTKVISDPFQVVFLSVASPQSASYDANVIDRQMFRVCFPELQMHKQSCLQIAKEADKEHMKNDREDPRASRGDEATLIKFLFGYMFDPVFVVGTSLYNLSLAALDSEIPMLPVNSGIVQEVHGRCAVVYRSYVAMQTESRYIFLYFVLFTMLSFGFIVVKTFDFFSFTKVFCDTMFYNEPARAARSQTCN
jgi:hypothetical protein